MDTCIFCEIVSGRLPCSRVYEDNDFLAFMDVKPVNRGHVLVVPKMHSDLVSGMSEESIGKMMIIAEKISSSIRKSDIKCEGINFFLADGEAAGQELFHVHLHVIPRFKNDGFGFKFPADYGNKTSRDELDELSRKIKL
ncbi:MAG: HIT domain-containing protein [Candidatus Aenigmatarchaeota archaeon]